MFVCFTSFYFISRQSFLCSVLGWSWTCVVKDDLKRSILLPLLSQCYSIHFYLSLRTHCASGTNLLLDLLCALVQGKPTEAAVWGLCVAGVDMAGRYYVKAKSRWVRKGWICLKQGCSCSKAGPRGWEGWVVREGEDAGWHYSSALLNPKEGHILFTVFSWIQISSGHRLRKSLSHFGCPSGGCGGGWYLLVFSRLTTPQT